MIGKTNCKAVQSLPCEYINITLQSNQNDHRDLIGATFTVSYGSYSKDYVWNGNEVTVEIPAHVKYIVSFGAVNGYKSPESVTNNAIVGNSRQITGTYQTCVLSVSFTDNQLGYNDIANVKANVVGSSVNAILSNGGSVKVPMGEAITITGTEVLGYSIPSTTYIANAANKSITLTYATEILTVNVSGVSSGYTIYVKRDDGTVLGSQTESSKTYKIPSGTQYYVEASDVTDYIAPTSYSLRTAASSNNASRSVFMVYELAVETLTVSVAGVSSGYTANIYKSATLASGYTELEYIESTDGQYIDTGFIPNQDTKLVVDFAVSDDNTGNVHIATATTNGSTPIYSFLYGTAGTDYVARYGVEIQYFTTKGTGRYTIIRDKEVTIFNDEIVRAEYTSFETASTITLFGKNNGSSVSNLCKMKLYSCQIYDNGLLVRDYVPAKSSAGIAGLYDRVNNIFYSSSSSTAFVAGTELQDTLIATQTSATGTHKIKNGVSYYVACSDVDGYVAPSNSEIYIAVAGNNRSVTMTYGAHLGTLNPINGVYIQDTDGYFHTIEEWDGSYMADCVAVITSSCRFGIALTEASSTMQIDSGYYGTLENYMTAIYNETQAKADYNGATNTANIMKLQSGTSYAAGWCNVFSFPSGKKGFLPSFGQMWAAYSNKAAVDAALTKAGGTALTLAYYWTSTFRGIDSYNSRGCWVLHWSNGNVYDGTLNNNRRARAFCSL